MFRSASRRLFGRSSRSAPPTISRGNPGHGDPYEVHAADSPDVVQRARPADRRFRRCTCSLSIAQPAVAQSGTAIQTGLGTIRDWMTTVASVVGVIAVMAVGYAKLTGRMDWGKAVTVLIGIGIIFSAATIVGWMGGSA
ncbi:TrbC/VirB2 family protein [Sphingomonas aerolata]|uniref:TrbC/VirB2 family protein n=1 Tax=Sphingomonas aerolata TaxID=185951 RepID=UPI002FE0B26B